MSNRSIIMLMLMAVPLFAVGATAVANASVSADTVSENLNEVVVTASNIVRKPTGYTISLKNQDITLGKNTVEVLRFLPNISERDGVITINGVAVSEITVDGRKVADMSELESIPAEMIDNVDVTYVAGADRLSDTAGGSISIRLKRAPELGYYGSLQGGGSAARRNGVYSEYLTGSLCARVERFSFYESPMVRWSQPKSWEEQTEITPAGSNWVEMKERRRQFSVSNTFSVNYDINDNHMLGLHWYIASQRPKVTAEGIGDDSYESLRSRDKYLANRLALKYDGRINGHGDMMSASVEWYNYDMDQDQSLTGRLDGGNAVDYIFSQRSNLLQGSADYSRPLGSNHIFNAGAIYKYIDLNTHNRALRGIAGAENYGEMQVNAHSPLVYASSQGQLGRFSYYLGLNWQLNRVKVDGTSDYSQNSINPTIQVMMPFGARGRHSVSVIYKHLLDNIPYDAISEKKIWSDPYNYTVGNKDLKAPTEHMVMLNLSGFNNMLGLSGMFAYVSDNIYWSRSADAGSDVTYTTPVNIGPLRNYGIQGEFNRRFFNCWTVKAVAWASFTEGKAELSGRMYDRTFFRHAYRLSNSLRFKHGWGGTAEAFFEPTFKDFDRTYHFVYNVNCSVYKTFMNNSLRVVLNFTPLQKMRVLDTRMSDRTIRYRNTTPGQNVEMRVVWYFNGGKKDVNVNIVEPTLDYREVVDPR